MLNTNIPSITKSDVTVPISMCQKVLSNIFTPMKVSSTPKPYLSSQNLSTTLLSIKNSDRSPKMAKMLEKKTIKGSCVTEKMAGIESTAKSTSENSITNNTTNSGVIYSL